MTTAIGCKVVTYGDTRGNKIRICTTCEAAMKADGVWPHNDTGEQYCQVQQGLTFSSHGCDIDHDGREAWNVH
jgi:hypothetical protein